MLTTRSVCPVCYKELPATITLTDKVMMHKTCPEHGPFTSVVDPDPVWWAYCYEQASPEYYKGYLVDVTNDCNLKCKYCYHDKDKTYRSVDDVLEEVSAVDLDDPIMLTGGEPTLHPELPIMLDRLSDREIWILTNGTMIADKTQFRNIISHGLIHGDMLTIGLSFHPESMGCDFKVLDLCRKLGYKLGTTFWVVDDLAQINDALVVLDKYRDVINTMRIKAATNLWSEHKAHNRIYTSDLVKYLEQCGAVLDPTFNIKVNYAPMVWRGVRLAAIAWYDKYNVDLIDSDCKPHYRAHDGSINDIVVTGIVNERIECTGS